MVFFSNDTPCLKTEFHFRGKIKLFFNPYLQKLFYLVIFILKKKEAIK